MISTFVTFVNACKSAHFIYDILIDKTEQLIDKIGSIELNEAKECLNKARCSNDKGREISRAITIMISARGKLSNDNKEKFQTTLLIAVCYQFINERNLSIEYLKEAKEQFNNWVDSKSPISFPIHNTVHHTAFLIHKGYFVDEVESLGMEWKGDMSIPEWRRNTISAKRDLREGTKHVKEDFSHFVDSLLR